MDELELVDVRAMLAAVPDGVVAPNSLTWTRLGPEDGILHTGESDGIVYAACHIANVDGCPENRDAAMNLIARAPSMVATLVGALDMACQQAVAWRDERDAARDLCKKGADAIAEMEAAQDAELERLTEERDALRAALADVIEHANGACHHSDCPPGELADANDPNCNCEIGAICEAASKALAGSK